MRISLQKSDAQTQTCRICLLSGNFGQEGRAQALAAIEHSSKHLEGAALVERLVEVAALGRLHARRTAVLARALVDQPPCIRGQHVELVEAAPRDPDAARMPVVD